MGPKRPNRVVKSRYLGQARSNMRGLDGKSLKKSRQSKMNGIVNVEKPKAEPIFGRPSAAECWNERQEYPKLDSEVPDSYLGDMQDDYSDDDSLDESDVDDLVGNLRDMDRVRIAATVSRRGTNPHRARLVANAIEVVLPRLAAAYATGSEDSCRCKERALKDRPAKVYCIGLLESSERDFARCVGCGYLESIISGGYFPTTPTQPRTAISFEVLDLFQSLSAHGSFSKGGFANAIADFHRGRLQVDPEVMRAYSEPFRQCIPFWLRTRRLRDEYVNDVLNEFVEREGQKSEAPRTNGEAQGLESRKLGEETNILPKKLSETPHGPANEEIIPKGRPMKFQLGSLTSLCPACFYRTSDEDKSTTVVSIDGNFQHYRMKRVGKDAHHTYKNHLFIDLSETERKQMDLTIPEKHPNCSHNFRAASKPHTMKCYDETGLISAVCRHDIPIRFLNMYAGERIGWIVFTVKSFLDLLRGEVGEEDIVVMYDVACQFGPHLKNNHLELLEFIRVAVNKFHGYAHEYKCHETWGAHQTAGIGDSDGEGTERVWALLRTLVSSGRESLKANRKLFIENLSFAIAERRRLDMGVALLRRYKNTMARLKGHKERLRMTLKSSLQPDKNNPDSKVRITMKLLEDEQKKQKEYFGRSNTFINGCKYTTLYDMLRRERELKKNIAINDEIIANGMPASYALIGSDMLPSITADIEKLLEKTNQTREEWVVGGEKDRLAARWASPDKLVYDRVLAEKEAELRYKVASMKDPKDDAHISSLKITYENEHQKTLKFFRDLYSSSEAEAARQMELWFMEGSVKYSQYHDQDVIIALEALYQQILQNVASATMKYRQLHSQVSGTKQYEKIMEAYTGKERPTKTLIKEFNEKATQLSYHLRPPILRIEAFKVNDDKEEMARESLFALHVIRSQVADLDCAPKDLWARHGWIRTGISDMLKTKRSGEEIGMLQQEWDRNVLYTRNFVVILLNILEPREAAERDPGAKALERYRPALTKLLWKEVNGMHRLIRAIDFAREEWFKEELPWVRACKPHQHPDGEAGLPEEDELPDGGDLMRLSYLDLKELLRRSKTVINRYTVVRNGMGLELAHDDTPMADVADEDKVPDIIHIRDVGNDDDDATGRDVDGDDATGRDVDGDDEEDEDEYNSILVYAMHMFNHGSDDY